MKEEKISEALTRSNKWWKESFEVDYKPREIYREIQRFFPKRQIIALVGLRRTGKTTLMYKLVKDALTIMDKENIVYFSFDEFKDIKLLDTIISYERLMGKDARKGKYLFLFDEIQKIENWEEQLKRMYDENNNIKFVISGSESLFIRKKSRESLAGRIYEFHIKTLSFKEHLDFRGKNYKNVKLYKEELIKELHNFLTSSGFPEIINEKREVAEKYIKETVIERIIYKDIPQMLPISEPAVLESLFNLILNDPGEMLNLNELSKEIGIARQTISLYLDYLEKSFLIRKLYNYSKNPRKTQRKLKKYYPTIISPCLADKKEYFGKVFETCMVNLTNAEFFWRDPFKNEVDIIKPDPLTAIEIKSGDIKERDIKPLKAFIKKFKPKKVIIISFDINKPEEEIPIIPFYSYILEMQ